VRVSIEMPSQGGRIKPGMFARVHIQERSDDALVVPLSSVVSADAKNFVFVRVAPNRFARREVVLGGDNGTDVRVARGLAEGDPVVVTNAILLKGMSFGY
jgi:Cu(I)/Ag(I) efflux system membrane fusion protein